jgi:AAA+ ATPase superfamily predicted ATPase
VTLRKSARRYPFQAGGSIGPDYFWGREDERRRVRQVYESGTIAVMSGQRRMGKTSLAEIVGKDLAASGQLSWAMLSVRETTAANFPSKLLATVFHLREGHAASNLFERAVQFARGIRLQPKVEADAMTGSLSFKVDAHRAGDSMDAAAVYHDILESLERVPEQSRRNVALVLDEFQDIAKSAPIFPEVLKTRARGGQGLAILIMGSSQHLMDELTNSPSAPLYRIGSQISLGPLSPEVVRKEVRRRFGWNGIKVTDAMVDRLFELCAGVSQDIQLVCLNGLEEALRHSWDELTTERLEIVVHDVVEQNLDRFVDKWNQLTAIQRDVLAAIAEYGGHAVLGQDFLGRINPARAPLPATVRRSVLAMVDKEILESGPPEGYRFKDALLAYYIRHMVANTSVGA